MENSEDNLKDIDLSSINWSKLSITEYNNIEKKLQESKILLKQNKKKTKRNSGFVTITLKGKIYSISEVTYQRLKNMKSQKSKDNLINEIILSSNPIESL
jgi:hypothetical protein